MGSARGEREPRRLPHEEDHEKHAIDREEVTDEHAPQEAREEAVAGLQELGDRKGYLPPVDDLTPRLRGSVEQRAGAGDHVLAVVVLEGRAPQHRAIGPLLLDLDQHILAELDVVAALTH